MSSTPDNFEPRIVAFLCNWCSYTGADLAGISRMNYPANVRAIRLMCSGSVKPFFIMSALHKGADGVLIGGCHIGDCHYQTGNHLTKKRIPITRELLGALGIDPRRVRLEWISAAEGQEFAEVIHEFVKELKALGPNPLAGGDHAH